MTEIVKRDGALLLVGGALSINPACCCDGPCPCANFDKLCTATLATPFGDIVFEVSDLESPPAWTTEIIDGVCWMFYDVIMNQDGCIGDCTDSYTPSTGTDIFVDCTVDWYPDGDDDPGCEGFEGVGTKRVYFDGQIVHIFRQLASYGELRIQYRYNCETEVLERKWFFKYYYSQDLAGFFKGDEIFKYDVDEPPCVLHITDTVPYNATTSTCEYFPLMPNRPGFPDAVDEDAWMVIGDIQGGMDFGVCAQVRYEEDWTVVSVPPFASDLTIVPKLTGIVTPGIHNCTALVGGIEVQVEYKCEGDYPRAFYEYDAPATFVCWICGILPDFFTLQTGGCTYPPEGITFIINAAAGGGGYSTEPDFSPSGFLHELTFATTPYDQDCVV